VVEARWLSDLPEPSGIDYDYKRLVLWVVDKVHHAVRRRTLNRRPQHPHEARHGPARPRHQRHPFTPSGDGFEGLAITTTHDRTISFVAANQNHPPALYRGTLTLPTNLTGTVPATLTEFVSQPSVTSPK